MRPVQLAILMMEYATWTTPVLGNVYVHQRNLEENAAHLMVRLVVVITT